jgi:uncharacterized membrane protein (DUF2068 family)
MDDQNRPQPQPDQPATPPHWAPPPAQPQQPQQPQWSPPPQQPAPGWGAPGYAAPPSRPMGVTVTGIFFVIWGVLVTLFGVLFLAIGQAGDAFEQLVPEAGGAFAGVVTVLAIFLLALGILWLASGVGIFLSKQWARIIGIIMGVLGVIIGGLVLLGSLSPEAQSDAGGIVIFGIVTVLSAVAVWSLVKAGPYFAYRR